LIESLNIPFEPDILGTIGLILVVAFLGSKVFQRLGIPQVVGYIVMGMLLGT
jgi:Kef-type K+ transport system membrane component KefB